MQQHPTLSEYHLDSNGFTQETTSLFIDNCRLYTKITYLSLLFNKLDPTKAIELEKLLARNTEISKKEHVDKLRQYVEQLQQTQDRGSAIKCKRQRILKEQNSLKNKKVAQKLYLEEVQASEQHKFNLLVLQRTKNRGILHKLSQELTQLEAVIKTISTRVSTEENKLVRMIDAIDYENKLLSKHKVALIHKIGLKKTQDAEELEQTKKLFELEQRNYERTVARYDQAITQFHALVRAKKRERSYWHKSIPSLSKTLPNKLSKH